MAMSCRQGQTLLAAFISYRKIPIVNKIFKIFKIDNLKYTYYKVVFNWRYQSYVRCD